MTLQINTTAGARDLTTDEQAEARTGLGAAAATELSAHSSNTIEIQIQFNGAGSATLDVGPVLLSRTPY